MAVTLNKANLVLKDANGNIGKIEQLSNRDLAKIKTAMSDVALVVNQSNHTPIKATTTTLGVVKPDGRTITIDSNGTLTATNSTHVTSADSATKATNDSSNRNIVNTYALKSNYPDRIKFAWDTTFKNNVNVTVDSTTWALITNQNISSQSVKHATTSDSATNANNLGGYPASNYIRSVNGITPNAQGNVQLGNIVAITGEIKWFAFNTAPAGYLVCNGATVSRETYADLFAKIGTTFGSGKDSTTFALPNLINRFAQGSTTVGIVRNSGLPNITGDVVSVLSGQIRYYGLVSRHNFGKNYWSRTGLGTNHEDDNAKLYDADIFFDASNSNPIYGSSNSVQPPALTLLPCIKY